MGDVFIKDRIAQANFRDAAHSVHESAVRKFVGERECTVLNLTFDQFEALACPAKIGFRGWAIVSFNGSSTSSPLWQQPDELGSRVAMSDGGGNGTPEADTSSRLRYTGQMALAELGLQYYKARFYNPNLGRFLQPDPVGLRGGMNFYEYVIGDPINRGGPKRLGARLKLVQHS